MYLRQNSLGIAIFPVAFLSPAAFAQGLITVYNNDFETPNPAQLAIETCADGGGTAGSYGTFSQNYDDAANGFIFQQVNTADRLCTASINNSAENGSHSPPWVGTGYADSDRPNNKFTGALIRQSGDYGYIETVAVAFPSKGQKFMDFSMDWSGLAVQLGGANAGSSTDFYHKVWVDRPNKNYGVKVRFFKLEGTDSLSLQDNGAMDASVFINNIAASPVRTEVFQFSSASTNGLSYDWNTMHYALDMTAMGFSTASQRLGVVWHLDTDNSYVGFDNILVPASQVPAAEIVKGVDDSYTLPNISDSFALPDITINDYVQGGGALINKASVSLLSNPQHGSLSTPDPTHPELIVYTPDGIYSGDVTFQYSVCDTSSPIAACTDSPVTVTIHIPPRVPSVSLICAPSVLVDSPNQISTCTVTSDIPAGTSGLSVNLTLPVANPRYTTSCASPLVIPAGSTTATCTVTATANTVVGDGSAIADLSIAPASTPSDYAVTGPAAQVTVNNDDIDPRQPETTTPVPTLSDWGVLLLSALTIGTAAFFSRRKRST